MKSLKVTFSDSCLHILKAIAILQSITATSVLEKAITNEKYILDKQSEGSRFLLLETNGTLREVIFK
jgi:hypothetical protein